ncbi:aldose 1-epimerase family protein [Jiulongibacter sediminis]|uniref:Aldose epimerase n=1 Tax=Jiulongibacter sediminis TaxID=1605367 RepID=A0A0N8H9Q2_9BACT|nr:aldose 1-epimerase family protein [Jiulongibacter sediminis]KPM48004.1 aldose epimerase [Jiulongibacter sediminis]TBX24186.1 aldose epimerase [Jiulongibacter sediminis]
MVCLQNDFIKVWIKPKGAELKSLVNKKTGVEYLWDANPRYWGKSSPVLFPIVGALKDNMYTFDGQTYDLPRHGFARDMMFTVESKSETQAIFLLKSDVETKKVYPFEFEFRLIYAVEKNKLTTTYEVKNVGAGEMYFSVGGHPAFAVPLQPEHLYTDYYLEFNFDSDPKKWLLNEAGLLNGEQQAVFLDHGKLPLTKELFKDDALVFKGLGSDQIAIRNQKNETALLFNFKDFPFFGIWAAKDAPFVCLEPWCGVADDVDHDQDLKNKEGINKLGVGESFERAWSVEVS